MDQARHQARADRCRQAAAEWASRAGSPHAQPRDRDAAGRQLAGAATAVRRLPGGLQQRAATRGAGTAHPASLYEPSPRPSPDRLYDPSYGCDVAVRRVRSNGQIKWAGELIFVAEALIGEPVGVVETQGGDWLVRFANVELGYIHPQRRRLSTRPLRGANRPGDLMEIAAAIPTTPQAHQPQQL